MRPWSGAILGLLIALRSVLPAAALLILGVTTLIGLQSWRLSVYLALAYLPVEGILWVVIYSHTAPAALAKDFLFVIPAYIGFFYWSMKSRRNVVFPGFPLLPLLLLADSSSSRSSTPFSAHCWWDSSGPRCSSTSPWRSSATT